MSSSVSTLYVNGSAASGSLDPGGYDYFLVSLIAGATYTISLNAASSGGLSDPFVYLVGATSNDYAFDDDSGGNLNAQLEFTPSLDGDYYVVAAAATNYDSGQYLVSVSSAAAPDDYPVDASGVITLGSTATGVIESEDDIDYFQISLTAGHTYSISLRGADSNGGSLLDPLLYGIYDAQADDFVAGVENDDGGIGRDAALVFTPDDSGEYFIAAAAYSAGTGSYTLEIVEGDTSVDGDVDDGEANAAPLSLSAGSGSATGSIDFADDSDWFAVSLLAGVTYTISLTGQDGVGGSLSDPYFAGVFDADGELIPGTSNDDYGDSYDSQISFTPVASATYFLAAESYSGGTGTYTLTVAGSATAPIETPAGTGTTVSISLGGTVRGVLETAGDVDWIAATLTGGQTYVFDLVGDRTAFNALSDPLIQGLYDGAGVLLPGTTNDDFGFTRDAQLTYTPASSGTYYLAATGFDDDTGAYSLRLRSNQPTVDLAGETVADAFALSVDAAAQPGAIDFARDVDWYKVTLTAGQRYAIDIRGADSGSGSLADPELIAIYDALGNVIPGTGGAEDELDVSARFTPVTSGDYYVAVSASDDQTGDYTITVRDVGGATADLADNVLTTAVAVLDTPFTSTIGTAGDVDWVRLELTAGTTYRLDLKGAPTDDGSLSDPVLLGVVDAQGMALADSADDDGGLGQNASATFLVPATGTYFAAVTGYANATGSYTLLASALGAGSGNDATAPRLLAISPADNSQQVAPGSNLTLVFDEAVRAGTGSITITGGLSPIVINVGDPQISFNGTTVTINPTQLLDDDTAYSVQVSAGAIADLAGNAFAGIGNATEFSFQTGALADIPAASWTVLVYMAADNNLESFALDDLNEMESVNFAGGLNVVTLVDRAPGYDNGDGDWTDTRAGLIVHDDNLNAAGSLGAEHSIGETNSGDGATLTTFINSAIAASPATNYALIVWDHGGGLSGTSWDDSAGGDNLRLAEFRSAVLASNLPHFDFIGFDACLQGMLEQCWDLRDLTDVMVASQELEPGDGWEYQSFLGALAADPAMTAFDFANAVVDAYGERYAGESDTTLAAVRTAALGDLSTSLNAFAATVLEAGPGLLPGLRAAAQHATRLGPSDLDYRDLGDFMQEVADTSANSDVRAAAVSAKAALDDAVMARVGTVAGVNGLSIYLPLDSISFDYQSRELGFLQGSEWGNFLRFLLSDQRGDDLLGDDADNRLFGFSGDDSMDGGEGDDTLDGGVGADDMQGGDGSDIYYVDDVNDVCTESSDPSNGGVDEVRSLLVAYTLGDFIENGVIERSTAASLRGNALANWLRGAAGDNTLAGEAGDDTLDGGAGNDSLDGGSGADRLIGGDGSDFYRVDNRSDLVVETNSALASGGTDAVSSSVTYTLGSNVERLSLSGSGAINGTGNSGNNGLVGNSGGNELRGLAGLDTLNGGAGSDRLFGDAGDDRLFGGLGNDTMTGGAGRDRFVFDTARGSSNIDRITDFVSRTDKILLDDDIFTRLSGSANGTPLAASKYKFITSGTGFAAGDADDRIIYNTNTDKLYYDPDGRGGAAAVQIAVVTMAGTAHPVAGDFLIIS